MRLSDFPILTFDCYGTLIDWETGMMAALQPLLDALPACPSRDAVLAAHARHESAQQAQTPTMPYRDVLAVVFKRLAEEWGAPADHEACVAYGRSVGDWPVFPDTVAALAYLKRFYKLVILSNVDDRSFAGTARRLEVPFDAVITAQDAGSYKPDPANFAYLLARLAPGLGGPPIGSPDVLHVAESLFHDHGPANAAGLRSAWIHRRHGQAGFGATMDPGVTPRFDWRFTSMAAFVEAHRLETPRAEVG